MLLTKSFIGDICEKSARMASNASCIPNAFIVSTKGNSQFVLNRGMESLTPVLCMAFCMFSQRSAVNGFHSFVRSGRKRVMLNFMS